MSIEHDFMTCPVCIRQREQALAASEAARIAAAINEYVDRQYRITNIYNPNLKENAMTVTTPPKAAATRKFVEVTKTVTEKEPVYTLELNQYQAGYLIDLLNAHLTGEIRDLLRPLSTALIYAGAARFYAKNNNKRVDSFTSSGYNYAFAKLDFAHDEDRVEAGVPAKAKSVF